VASSKTAEREARVARERLRQYNARQSVHTHKVSRRRRDNVLWVIVGLLVVTAAAVTQVVYFSSGPGAPAPAPVESMDPVDEGNVGDVPDPSLAEARTWTGELTLNDVALGIELDGAAAPQGVSAFIQDVRNEYFPAKTCHRLTNAGFFVLQCGSVDGAGSGDPGFRFGPIENAPSDDLYPAGTIAMARASGNAYSNGHQFFIVYEDTTIPSDSAGGYTVIGSVTSGLDELIEKVASQGVVGGATDGEPVVPTSITSVSVE
jgi:peptidyl-prolyl cis-trans isomerase B (cyclophilin B)